MQSSNRRAPFRIKVCRFGFAQPEKHPFEIHRRFLKTSAFSEGFECYIHANLIAQFETVGRAVGDQPSVLYYLGRLDLEEQNYQGAVGKLSKASSQPPFPDTAFYLGFAYLKLGSHAEAEKWLKKAIELNAEDSRAEYELARLYRQQGRQEDAGLQPASRGVGRRGHPPPFSR